MKYLILDADYRSTGIKDLEGNFLSKSDLCISDELWNEIQIWVNSYAPIVMMDEAERTLNLNTIQNLDKHGIELCKKLKSEISEGAKIEYFSEGLLTKIFIKL